MNERGHNYSAKPVNAWLFDASCDSGAHSFEIRVHNAFTESEAASVAEKYGKAIDRLPRVLRAGIKPAKGLQKLAIHKGNNAWFVSRAFGIVSIYPESRIETYHEEVLVHEAAHVSLDNQIQSYYESDPAWLAAQTADGAFISSYAKSYPGREDVAESFVAYLAARYLRSRISKKWETTIYETIPNRIAYFDALLTASDMTPFTKTSPRVAGLVIDNDSLSIEASDKAAYVIRLLSPPDASVTVTPESDDTTAATVSAPLTFTTGNWRIPQTVTVTGAAPGTATISHTTSSTSGKYENIAAADLPEVSVTVSGTDNPVSLSVNGNGAVAEGDPALTVTATLGTANATGQALAIPVRVRASGTTASSADYTRAGTISIADGAISGTTDLAVVDDGDDEPGETLIIELGSPLPLGLAAGVPDHVTITIADNDDPTNPVSLSVSSNGAVDEGDPALTVTATLGTANATGQALAIPVQVRASGTTASAGDYTLAGTISIADGALSGETDFEAVDDGDVEVLESVVVELGSTLPSGLSAGAPDHVTIELDDNDAPVSACLSATVLSDVQGYAQETGNGGAHVTRWKQALAGFGARNGETEMTAAAAKQHAEDFSASRWNPVVTALRCLNGPEVTVAGGNGITEGGDAAFTVTAAPAVAWDVTVTLAIGDDAVSDFLGASDEGEKTVTIPANQPSATLTVSTENDSANEANGSVSARLVDKAGYYVGDPGAASVAVADDDAAAVPSVSLSAGAAVTEGGDAVFTVTADPAPSSDLDVTLDIEDDAASDFLGTNDEGSHTVTILANQPSATLTLATLGDSTDEANGVVTASVQTSNDYKVAAAPDDTASPSGKWRCCAR